MNIFFDTEFTGSHQATTLISIGLVSEDGRMFYAEYNDYDESQVGSWIKETVIANLRFEPPDIKLGEQEHYLKNSIDRTTSVDEKWNIEMRGNSMKIKEELTAWLWQFDEIEMWSDCLSYDWVLFNNIFGHAFNLPSNIYYIPFDICTLFKAKGINPDVSREGFVNLPDEKEKHNALFDATIIKLCYDKLTDQSNLL